ncbi:DUF1848 family protein [Lucifera butyrica]|nr:DUF1848 family protein [Lucifera butyrica]
MAERMKPVISASRRTDLPGCHYAWLQNVLTKGAVSVRNPVYKNTVSTIDVRPQAIHSLVLWSKNFAPVAENPGQLENYNLYFQYTINHYAARLEPGVPPYGQTLKTLDRLLRRYRPEQFTIRFDPVIFSPAGEISAGPGEPAAVRLQIFEELCRDLITLGMNGCRLTTSYIALYGHVRRRLTQNGVEIATPGDREVIAFFRRMAEIAARYNLPLYSCASLLLEQIPQIQKGHCIDGGQLTALFDGRASKARDTGQREACGCTKSLDIGSYEQRCGHQCLYCYGQKSLES